jgi:hypothetical protein
VGDDELAVVAVQIRPGRDETPAEAARRGIARIDLDADPGDRPGTPCCRQEPRWDSGPQASAVRPGPPASEGMPPRQR